MYDKFKKNIMRLLLRLYIRLSSLMPVELYLIVDYLVIILAIL